MEEKIEIGILLNLYGKLLTKTQQHYMDLYYNKDFSLSEIGEIEGITRQAVRTILIKSKEKLYETENLLKVMQKQVKIKNILNKLEQTDLNKQQQQLIKKIDNELEF